MIVNQKFIAEKAGVSQKTVSLYFKERALVGRKTREKIEAVTERHNYFPNSAARSIRSNRFNRIACVVVQYGSLDSVLHPHMMAYINGASRELARYGYSLVVEPVFIELDGSKVDFPEFFSIRSADGIIGIAGSWVPPEVDRKIAEMGLPTVWLNRKSNGPDLNCLLFDEAAGAIELAEHFLKQGIRDIVWFGPEYAKDLVIHYSSQVRYEAVKATMEKHGGRCEALFCRTGETLNANARKVCEMLPEFDGAICYNYTYRHALLLETLATGRNVNGKRIGHFASMWEFHPCEYDFLDYVVMPEVEMGRCGAKYILKTLRGKNADDLLVQLKGKLHKQ